MTYNDKVVEAIVILAYLGIAFAHGWVAQKFLNINFFVGLILGFFCPGIAIFILFIIDRVKN